MRHTTIKKLRQAQEKKKNSFEDQTQDRENLRGKSLSKLGKIPSNREQVSWSEGIIFEVCRGKSSSMGENLKLRGKKIKKRGTSF